jgi:hypothetical protein
MAVTLYRQVGKGKSRRYQKVNLGRGRRPADLTGPYFLRYSLGDHCRLRAVAEHLPVCIDPVHRWVVLRDVFFAHHFPGATSRPAGVPWKSGLYLFGRVPGRLTAGGSCE